MMRADLKAAGIPYVDERGRYADFHSLRHTYVSRVVESGATVKVAQELARHSSPSLTIGRYSHVRLHDMGQALDHVATGAGVSAEAAAEAPAEANAAEAHSLGATGTEDARGDGAQQPSPPGSDANPAYAGAKRRAARSAHVSNEGAKRRDAPQEGAAQSSPSEGGGVAPSEADNPLRIAGIRDALQAGATNETERAGFEPAAEEVPPRRFSKPVP